MRDLLRAAPCVAVFGSALAGFGALAMVVLVLFFDPATSGETTRRTMNTAFGAAQTGLALVAGAVLHRLYSHAVRLGTRRDR